MGQKNPKTKTQKTNPTNRVRSAQNPNKGDSIIKKKNTQGFKEYILLNV